MPLFSQPTNKTILVGLLGLVGGALSGVGMDHAEAISRLFTGAAQNQIAQAGMFFTIAAWLHAGRVKKEIRSNFESLTVAISQVADAFRADLRSHTARLDNLASRVQSLEDSKNLNKGD